MRVLLLRGFQHFPYNFRQHCKYSARDRAAFPQENRALLRVMFL
ncbi:hypothetical protein GXM_04415 [Nostoc sphaeroides CCNUC1]|uniref:Uncharacterized protein n=1 Tax=Nostoc sphaeroides CCNUC1 TaxID=2653204 RepID=A0A5P8W2U3_9NOSO|nr:hypothetical protein GXM_04415 [Nostoc sphaeroides CCNUC1]